MDTKHVLSCGTASRKVAMFVPVFVVSTALLWFGKIVSAEWIELTKWSAMTLFAALSVEHFAPKS